MLGIPLGLAASPGYFNVPTNEDDALGFRVASIPSIPEPSTGLLAALGMVAGCKALGLRASRARFSHDNADREKGD